MWHKKHDPSSPVLAQCWSQKMMSPSSRISCLLALQKRFLFSLSCSLTPFNINLFDHKLVPQPLLSAPAAILAIDLLSSFLPILFYEAQESFKEIFNDKFSFWYKVFFYDSQEVAQQSVGSR